MVMLDEELVLEMLAALDENLRDVYEDKPLRLSGLQARWEIILEEHGYG